MLKQAISYAFPLLRIVAVATVLLCGTRGTTRYALVPVGIIVIYAALATVSHSGDAEGIEYHADQTYFVGYVSTIAAFLAAIAYVLKFGIPRNPRPILWLCGIALAATVTGLLTMTFMKDYAWKLRRNLAMAETEWRERVLKAAEAIAGLSGLSVPAHGEKASPPQSHILIEASDKTATIVEEVNQHLFVLGTSLEALIVNIGKLKTGVDSGSDATKMFAASVEQVQAVLDDFVRLLKAKFLDESSIEGRKSR